MRGDLIQSLRRIGIRHSIGQVHLDGILIELTGMADPAPVVYLGWLVGWLEKGVFWWVVGVGVGLGGMVGCLLGMVGWCWLVGCLEWLVGWCVGLCSLECLFKWEASAAHSLGFVNWRQKIKVLHLL